jgi:hypothetical protein
MGPAGGLEEKIVWLPPSPRGNAMNGYEIFWLAVLAAVVGLVVWRTLRGMERRRRML